MKKSSYQKLKEENKKLRNEIHILVNDPMSYKAIELQVIYSRPVITPIMFSSRQKPPFMGGGILGRIEAENLDKAEKLDFNTIKTVFEEFSKNKPLESPEFKCGSLFHQALFDANKGVVIKGMPFKDSVVNPELFGMKVVLDETLPADMARIGDNFFRLNNTQNK